NEEDVTEPTITSSPPRKKRRKCVRTPRAKFSRIQVRSPEATTKSFQVSTPTTTAAAATVSSPITTTATSTTTPPSATVSVGLTSTQLSTDLERPRLDPQANMEIPYMLTIAPVPSSSGQASSSSLQEQINNIVNLLHVQATENTINRQKVAEMESRERIFLDLLEQINAKSDSLEGELRGMEEELHHHLTLTNVRNEGRITAIEDENKKLRELVDKLMVQHPRPTCNDDDEADDGGDATELKRTNDEDKDDDIEAPKDVEQSAATGARISQSTAEGGSTCKEVAVSGIEGTMNREAPLQMLNVPQIFIIDKQGIVRGFAVLEDYAEDMALHFEPRHNVCAFDSTWPTPFVELGELVSTLQKQDTEKDKQIAALQSTVDSQQSAIETLQVLVASLLSKSPSQGDINKKQKYVTAVKESLVNVLGEHVKETEENFDEVVVKE
ncbi:hypothetical protein M8C21_025773, partial [Ambrosia artemisiifolia]